VVVTGDLKYHARLAHAAAAIMQSGQAASMNE
jgi:hypothetical protein